MNKHTAFTRLAMVLTGGVLAVLTAGGSATARPDDSSLLRTGPAAMSVEAMVCPLGRVGHQFVRCDDLTGDGEPAPAYVPEEHVD